MTSLLDVLQLMRRCVPWGTMSRILKSLDISKSQGWEATINKINSDLEAPEMYSKRADTAARLRGALIEYLHCGQKDFRIYKVDESDLSRVANFFDSFEVKSNDFSDNYPFSAYRSLDKIKSTDVLPAFKQTVAGTTAITMCSIRSYDETVRINRSELPTATIEHYDLDEESKIFAKKKQRRQFYDVVAFNPSSQTIEVRIDKSDSMHPGLVLKFFHDVERSFEKLITAATGKSFKLRDRINLFPVIDKLYQSEIGRACELGFMVDSGSVKHEKARKDPEADIRTETFHSAGRAAVDGRVSPFRIGIEWHLRQNEKDECFPELLLPGTKKSLYDQAKEPLNVGHIKGCFYEKDFQDIISQLVSLKNEN